VTRLRALIILPTKDLVMQVRETMEELARGSGLKVSRLSRDYILARL
jgi:ATP-dependent RNA helicase DDX51/DBP6